MDSKKPEISRRAVIGGAVAMSSATALPAIAKSVAGSPAFLWGASTAGHQIEGNNVNSDAWVMENVKPTFFAERSGDACDSYHRYERDITLLKSFGLNSYRFSIEWARIEPSPGQFSIAELDYYKRIVDFCHKVGVMPCVTFCHYTTPAWFAASGGFHRPDSPDLFARFCDTAARHLADGLRLAFTLNEPEVPRLLKYLLPAVGAGDIRAIFKATADASAKALGSDQFVSWLNWDEEKSLEPLTKSHRLGRAAIKAVRSDLPVGAALSIWDYQPIGPNSIADQVRQHIDGPWYEAVRGDDFVGIQNYSRLLFDSEGLVKPKPGAELTANGLEFYPEALGRCATTVHRATGLPIVVTENGIDTRDDTQRVRYIDGAIKGLREAMAGGVPVQGYFHWSLLDNFEWASGYKPRYGLVEVDRQTFERKPKPSAFHYGAIAKRGIA